MARYNADGIIETYFEANKMEPKPPLIAKIKDMRHHYAHAVDKLVVATEEHLEKRDDKGVFGTRRDWLFDFWLPLVLVVGSLGYTAITAFT